MVYLSFVFSITGTYTACTFLQGRLRGQSVLAVGCHSSVHMCEDDASTACAWAALCNTLQEIYQKEQKQVSIKKKSSWCRDGSMHECTGCQSTQTRSAMHTLHNMATLFNNHPYMSSNNFSANWCATATYMYVGMVVEECGHVMECIRITVCMALLVCVICQPCAFI